MKKKIILLIIAIAAFSAFFISCGESDTKKEQGAVTEEPGEIVLPVDESTQALGEAFFRLFASDAEGQFVLRAGEISLSGNLQISLDGAILAYIDTEISGVPASLGFQAEDGQNCVFLDAFGAKLYFDLADLPEVAERLSALAEGREPSFTEGETGEKIYPPFEIAGFNVQTVFDLLSDFDATSLLPLMAEISGEKTEEGFSYDIPLAEGVSILLEVNSERDLKTFSLAAGESLSFGLTEIRAPEEKLKAKLDPVADGYTDIKQYIYIAEKFCDEKIESVPELIAAVGRIDLGKAAALVSGIAERRAVSFSAEVNAGGVAATAAVSLDFSEELRAAVSAEVSGVEVQLTLFGGELYARAGAITLKGDAADAKKILSMFGVEFNAQGLSFENLAELFSGLIAGDVLDKISVENGEIRISAFGLEIVFSPEDLTLSVSGGGFTARIFDLAVGTGVSAPEGEYTEAEYLLPLAEKALALVNGGAVSVGGTVSVGQTEIALDARLRLQPFAVSGAAEIGGTKIGFSYDGEKLFLSAGEVSVSMDRLAAKKILDGLTSGLPAFEMPSPDMLLGMIASVAADETGAEIVADLSYFGAGTIALRAAAEEEGISLSVSAESLGAELAIGAFLGGIEMPEKASDVSGFVRAVDIPALLRLAEGILTEKTANASFTLQAEGLQAEGTAAVGFADGLRAEISASIGENEIRAYYAEGVLYLEKQGVRLSADTEDIGALLALFGIKADGLKTTFSAIGIGCEGEELIIEIGGAKIAVNGKTLQAELSFAGVKASVSGIAAGGDVSAPEGEFVALQDILPLIETISQMIGEMRFSVSGSLAFGGENATKLEIPSATVYSAGNGDIAADFREGRISIGGELVIGESHRLNVAFDGADMYLCYNDAMKVRFSRASLDGLVQTLKENFAFIMDGFVKAESLTQLFDSADYAALIGMIASLSAERDENGAVTLAVTLALPSSAISVSVGEREGGAEIFLSAEGLDCGLFLQPLAEDAAPVAAPENAEEYIDLSDIGYLADGFFKTAKSGEFVMSGTVAVKLDVLGIDAVLDIGLQAQVRINFGEDGKISGVDAHVVFDNTAVARKGTNDLENTTVSAIHDLAVKYGRCEITFTKDTLYIDRMNMSKSIRTLTNTTDKFPFFEIRTGYQFEETAYEHKSVAAADAQGETLQDLIFYALGVNSMLADLFPSGGEADYARLLDGYVSADKDGQGVPHEHDVTLSLAALVGSDMFQPVAVKIFTGADNRIEGVSVKDLTIDFSVGTLKVDLEAENDLSAELDGSCFENYLQFEYQPFAAA